MKLKIPELSLVLLIGPAGSGKSTFAKRHFRPSEILSSDFCRYLVSDDENNQAATADAFAVLHLIAARRLASGRLTVVDATNVQVEARRPLLEMARRYYVAAIGIVLDLPELTCEVRDRERSNRNVGPHVIHTQAQWLHESLRGLEREGFNVVHVLQSTSEVDELQIERQPLRCRRQFDRGPFDVIGDVHGCYDELVSLLRRLGYEIDDQASIIQVTPPSGRKAVFTGDLSNLGPDAPSVLRLVMTMVNAGSALVTLGDHDLSLLRKLRGEEEFSSQIVSGESRDQVVAFLDSLPSHLVLDDGKLVVAHAGLRAEMQGRDVKDVRDFALANDSQEWAAQYSGHAAVVYGHRPVLAKPEWLNNTLNIDTGCVFGGSLTALRYPEMELVSVPAKQTYQAL